MCFVLLIKALKIFRAFLFAYLVKSGKFVLLTARRHTQCENLNENNMSVPKNIKDFPSFAIVNLLRCPVEDQISVVSKLLKH